MYIYTYIADLYSVKYSMHVETDKTINYKM